MKGIRQIIAFSSLLLAVTNVKAQPKLPAIFGDSMVLQRDQPLRIWGTAHAGERITVSLHGQNRTAIASPKGSWQVVLAAEKAGGPYDLTVSGKEKIVLRGVMMGDIWFCSGQSNMEMPLKGWGTIDNADAVIQHADYHNIRLYTVAKKVAALPLNTSDEAGWQSCTPATVPSFSAVAYFFGRRLQEELHVPIGLINSTWGGTQIESWISHAGLAQDPHYKAVMQHAPAMSMEELLELRNKKEQGYQQQLLKDLPNAGDSAQFKTFAYDHRSWSTMPLPGPWEQQSHLSRLDGIVWFRKTIAISEEDANKPASFHLGKIDDNDQTFLNGDPLGATNGWNMDRVYDIAANRLKAGKNVIAVRVDDLGGGGGIWGDTSELYVSVNGHRYSLTGDWSYRIQEVKASSNNVGPNDYPSLLFNAMVNPFGGLNIKGVIWYQGEANAGRGFEYRYAMPLLIRDWRRHFRDPYMPFYFVQLTSFNDNNGNSNNGSTWAELRESQTITANTAAHCGMAVITDIGDASDIHPRNKQDVGHRLARLALKGTYGRSIIASGPVYKSYLIQGRRIRLEFSSTGEGLTTRDGQPVHGFEIAGDDKKFYPAEAALSGNKLVLQSPQVPKPVAVRYAWADEINAANLCNKEGLPAWPFRTDNWPGITIHKKFDPALK
ncbi:MAG: 9-O-acetylesterase [Chitinophagaceae bacterium]|nr:9-O-acetylesterase [Chitinophagaceae bacterium]